MGRQKMSCLDVRAVVSELRQLIVGTRLQNLYDLDPRTYVLKFSAENMKVLVFVETGARMHITELIREKPRIPSQFTLKLRKHVRNWRLDSIDQCGADRVVDMKFGANENCYHFIIELHSRGNFVLTDNNYKIMMVLHVLCNETMKLAVGETYPINSCQIFAPISRDPIIAALEEAASSTTLKQAAVGACPNFGPMIIEHALLVVGMNPNEKKSAWAPRISQIGETVAAALKACERWFVEPVPCGGFAVAEATGSDTPSTPQCEAAADASNQSSPKPRKNIDFSPVMLKQFESPALELSHKSSFSAVVEMYFFPIESERIERAKSKQTTAAQSTVERCEELQQKRIMLLKTEEELNCSKAKLIIENAQEIDQTTEMIRMSLGTGMNWDALRDVIRRRKREGHPIANIIHELHLDRGSMTVLLARDVGVDEEDCDIEPMSVDIDINLTAHANANRYFEAKRFSAKKLTKTVSAADRALEGAQRKAEAVAGKKPVKREIQAVRSTYWFEKFFWFLTSFGHLVVSPRDPHQADALVKRYMKPGDFFVHSDALNASICIVKNPTKSGMPIASLEEAGTSTVCRSGAWNSRSAVSAWWAYATQVSKQSPSGEFLNPGAFHVQGKKNYLAAMPLMLGVALVFRVNHAHLPPALVEAAEGGGVTAAEHGIAGIQSSESECLSIAASAMAAAANTPVEYISAEAPALVSPSPVVLHPSVARTLGAKGLDSMALARQPVSEVGDESENSPKATPSSSPSVLYSRGAAKLTAKDRRLGRRVSGASVPSSTSESADLGSTLRDLKDLSGDSSSPPMLLKQHDKERNPEVEQVIGIGMHPQFPSDPPLVPQSHSIPKMFRQRRSAQQRSRGSESEDTPLLQSEPRAPARGSRRADEQLSELHNNLEKVVKQRKADEQHSQKAKNSDDSAPETREKNPTKSVHFSEAVSEAFAEDDKVAAEHAGMRRKSSSFEEDEAKIEERMSRELHDDVPLLCGCPSADDQVQFVVPVCAPFASVMHYKYRVKVTPGRDKKGSAARTVVDLFSSMHSGTDPPDLQSEMKHIAADTVAQILVGSVKVHPVTIKAPRSRRAPTTPKPSLAPIHFDAALGLE